MKRRARQNLIIVGVVIVALAHLSNPLPQLSPSAANAAENLSMMSFTMPAGLVPERSARIVGVIDGDTVTLDDGTEVRLVGLQAPKLALGRTGFVEWPLAPEARAALAGLALDRHVGLAYGGRRTDRHGRQLAHLVRDDGLWLQGAMLELGMARVYSFADNRAAATEMLALEQAARTARRGIWAHPAYAVRDPGETGRYRDTFQLVEGVVVAAEEVQGRVYLNFGQNWRDDFTVTIGPKDRNAFTAAGFDPMEWAGRRLEVRGWLIDRNGPMIEATHPEQIEVLEER